MTQTFAPPSAVVTVTAGVPTMSTARRYAVPSAVVRITAGRPTMRHGGVVYTPAGTGAPSYPFTLFRGCAIGVKASRQGELLRLEIDCEDYGRLAGLIKVGAPVSGSFVHQDDPPPDGTDVAIDANAQTAGAPPSAALLASYFTSYWVGRITAAFDVSTHVETIDPGGALPDFSTASTDWQSFAGTIAAYTGPYVHWWLDADLALWVTELAPVGTRGRFAVDAPYALDEDGPPGDGVILPMKLTADWDFSKVRKRLFVRGGTPLSYVWVENPDASVPATAGEDYVDAPGALTADDAKAVGLWHFAAINRMRLSGTAHVESGHNGWRPGQTLTATSARLSTPSRPLAATPTILQHVTGRLVGPGPGLTFTLVGVGVIDNVTWQTFEFSNGFGAEKATIVVEIVDPDETLEIAVLADISVTLTGDAAIEYDLIYGDVDAGDIAKALARFEPETKVIAPVYKFIVTIDDPDMPPPDTGFFVCRVTAQLVDASKKPWPLAGVRVEWVLLQWADKELTIPGDGYSLSDAVGITDATGLVVTDLFRAAREDDSLVNSIAYKINALALPI